MPPLFHCALCGKSYARAPELEAHENSYDHQHKKRLREIKSLTRNTGFGIDKARRKDADAGVLGGNIQSSSSSQLSRGQKGDDKVKREKVDAGEEMCTVTGPVRWEELDDLAELVDLRTSRPEWMGGLVDGGREWEGVRRDEAWYKDLWAGVGREDVDEEGEEEEDRVGLGAGGYEEDSEEEEGRARGLGA